MIIKDFFESKEKLVIHCNTEDKAKALLKAFDREGYRWSNGTRYIDKIWWREFKKETCYSNGHRFCDIGWYKNEGYKVIEFEDIEEI